VSLPLERSFAPMEAETASELPNGGEWQYEPKWDGFRALAFRDGSSIRLQSKAGKPLARYFPDVAESLERLAATRFVLDGEIVIPVEGRLSFDELLLRVHPAASRVRTLVEAHRARLMVFDLLVDERGRSLVDLPLEQRRARLEAFAERFFPGDGAIVLSRVTRHLRTARRWLAGGGHGDLDGVVAKRLDLPYRSGERDGMLKVKRQRTADCVVGGFRYASRGGDVGSLLLGLYDGDGRLDHVGFCSGLSAEVRQGLRLQLERLRRPPGFTGRAPGGPSRWSTERSAQWEPLGPKLVVEVAYDHVSNGRFRHGTRFLRWRPDKDPRQCSVEQIT
jgi:ATP-dependent DNA ligase